MAVVQALQAASNALRRNPIIIGLLIIISLLQLPTQLVQIADPIASTAINAVYSLAFIIATPFIFGGAIGIADEALDGRTSFDTFVDTGKRYYKSMFGAYLLVIGAGIGLSIVASLISIAVVAVMGIASGGMSGGMTPMLIGMFLTGTAVFLLVLFVPLFFVQFYGQAIVLDEESAVSGFQHSFGLVRQNLISVFGYSVLVFVGGLFFGLLVSIPSTLLSLQATQVPISVPLPELSLTVTVVLTFVGNIVFGILGSLFLVFSVAFYRTLESVSVSEEPPASQGTAA